MYIQYTYVHIYLIVSVYKMYSVYYIYNIIVVYMYTHHIYTYISPGKDMSLSDRHRHELAQGGEESWFQTTCPASCQMVSHWPKEHIFEHNKNNSISKHFCMVENKNYPVVLLQATRLFDSNWLISMPGSLFPPISLVKPKPNQVPRKSQFRLRNFRMVKNQATIMEILGCISKGTQRNNALCIGEINMVNLCKSTKHYILCCWLWLLSIYSHKLKGLDKLSKVGNMNSNQPLRMRRTKPWLLCSCKWDNPL